MKQSVMFVSVAFSMLFVLASCDFSRDHSASRKSQLSFKAELISKSNSTDTVLFTGKDIKSINGTTGEIRFVDASMIFKIKSFHRVKCYLGSDSLFTATVTLPVVSSLVNDLVLNLKTDDGHFYFEDGYPDWINNQAVSDLRIKNKEKRATAWSRFIDELKKEEIYIK
jgi:hypothetical protein